MPAPREPNAEEQLARTNNAKRIGPSAKTLWSLGISNNMHRPTVEDPRAECHRRIEQYTWPARGKRAPEPRPGDISEGAGHGWGQQRCLSFLATNANRDGVEGDPPEGQHIAAQRGRRSPAPAAGGAAAAAGGAPAAEDDTPSADTPVTPVIEATKPPSVRFDNKEVVARACHCLLESRDELGDRSRVDDVRGGPERQVWGGRDQQCRGRTRAGSILQILSVPACSIYGSTSRPTNHLRAV